MVSPGTDRVLFLCERNTARSQIAEALLRHHAADRFEAFSAGLVPGAVDQATVQVLEELGIPTSRLRSKDISEFFGQSTFAYAIIVCIRTMPDCPRFFPFAVRTLYWPFEDPASAGGDDADRLAIYRDLRDRLDERLRAWIAEVDTVGDGL